MTSISVSTSTQLDAIYSMMEDGQHSVKMERHSLLIWGITAAGLILITDLLFNKEVTVESPIINLYYKEQFYV